MLFAAITTAAIWAWMVAHQLVLYYVFAVLIEQMPPPDDKSGKFYRYVYSVIQVLAANLRRTKDAVKSGPVVAPQPPKP